MTWLNRYDIEDLQHRFDPDKHPNLRAGAKIMLRLMRWVDSHSDGWPYWNAPSRAATKLQDLLQEADRKIRRDDIEDITEADLKKACVPIKAFLTKRGVDHEVVFPKPTPVEVIHDDALSDMAHQVASQLASNAINSGEVVDFLLSQGVTNAEIERELERAVAETRAAER